MRNAGIVLRAGLGILLVLVVGGMAFGIAAVAFDLLGCSGGGGARPQPLGPPDEEEGEERPSSTPPVLAGRSETPGRGQPWSVVVTVLWEDGRPAAGEVVDTYLHVKEARHAPRTTDAAGRVRFGPYAPPMHREGIEVDVETRTHEGEPAFVRALPADDGSAELRATVRLVPSIAVSGRVELPDGVPSEHACLWLHRPWARDHDHGDIPGLRLTLDADGRFFTKYRTYDEDGLSFGLEVTIAHEGRRWYGSVGGEAPARDVSLPVGPLRPGDPAILRVRVRTPEGIVDEPNVSVNFDDGLRTRLNGYDLPVAEEAFEADEPPPFERCFLWQPHTEIYVEASTYADGDAWGTATVGPLPAHTTDVEIELPPARTLRGRLRTTDGRGVEGVSVTASLRFATRRGFPLAFAKAEATTGEGGTFEIGDLGPHAYLVNAKPKASQGTVRTQEVAMDQDEVELVLQPPASALIRVLDAVGEPVEGARVSLDLAPHGVVLDPDRLPLRLTWPCMFEEVAKRFTSEAGEVAFKGLDRERAYRLVVEPPPSRADLQWIDRQGWTPRDETLRLAGGLTIAGVVRDEEGEPVPGAVVHIRPLDPGGRVGVRYRNLDGSEGVWLPRGHVERSAGGAFAVGPLPPGRYGLSAGRREVVAPAGAEGVELVGVSAWDQLWVWIRVEDWRPDDRGAYLLFGRTGARVRVLPLGPGGRVVVPHVGLAERPDVWILGLADGRVVWQPALELSEEQEQEGWGFAAKAGGTIRGRIVLPPDLSLESWRVEPVGPLLRVDGDGRALGAFPCLYGDDRLSFTLTGVPPGTWSVRVTAKAGSKTLAGAVEALAGDDVEIELTLR